MSPRPSKEREIELMESAIALLQGIKPQGEIEGMFATQMVAAHSAAMECLRRAMIDGQTLDACDLNLKHAAKLLTIYARQIETLDKHRGKGQQKVTVEHVHVAAGGQAVVGNIEAAALPPKSGKQSNDAPKAITHAPRARNKLGKWRESISATPVRCFLAFDVARKREAASPANRQP